MRSSLFIFKFAIAFKCLMAHSFLYKTYYRSAARYFPANEWNYLYMYTYCTYIIARYVDIRNLTACPWDCITL